MRAARFVELHRPRRVLVDRTTPHPRHYYLDVIDALNRCSLPAARRFGPLRAAVARHGLGRAPLSALLALQRPRPCSELDRLRGDLEAGWQDLAQSSDRLPAQAPALSFLSLRRSLGSLVFVFGNAPDPLLVCKIPDGDDPRVDDEAAVLDALARTRIAPRYLGKVGHARVQEALPGTPLVIEPLRRTAATRASWDETLAEAASSLTDLGRATVGGAGPVLDVSENALELLSDGTAARVRAGVERLDEVAVSVTCHGDASPQNLMVSSGRVAGLVDWELARRGLPGADILNLAQSVFEQRLGLVRWSPDEVLNAFSAAWDRAPLFTEGRQAARAAALAVGVRSDLAADLEIAHFARRLQRRVARPAHYVGGVRMAAAMVERVCAS